MDTRDLIQIISQVRTMSPEKTYEYSMFFEKPEVLEQGQADSIRKDLGGAVDELHKLKPGFAKELQTAVHCASSTNLVDIPEGARFLPATKYDLSSCEKLVKSLVSLRVSSYISTELWKTLSKNKKFYNNVNDFKCPIKESLIVTLENPRIVYHPYSVINIDPTEPQVRDMVNGMIHPENTAEASSISEFITHYSDWCDAAPAPGSIVNKPAFFRNDTYFFPKLQISATVECKSPIELTLNRKLRMDSRREGYTEPTVEHVKTSEKWIARLTPKFKAEYMFHTSSYGRPIGCFDGDVEANLQFIDGKIEEIKNHRPVYVWGLPVFSAIIAFAAGSPFVGHSGSPAPWLAVPAAAAVTGIPAYLHYLRANHKERAELKKAIKTEWITPKKIPIRFINDWD